VCALRAFRKSNLRRLRRRNTEEGDFGFGTERSDQPRPIASQWHSDRNASNYCWRARNIAETPPKARRNTAESTALYITVLHCTSIQYRGVSTGCESVRFD